jgi:C_GCAxxG_C_C family probable redox protein
MKKNEASQSFQSGHNCAQAVVSTFAPDLGLSREQALKLATGLGAGTNYNGRICGAVMGAFITLGLKYGTAEPTDRASREKLKGMLDELSTKFKKEYGSIECNQLLKSDISDPEQLQKLREENVFHTYCVKIVERVTELTEEILQQNK